jgi:hypothetical protein
VQGVLGRFMGRMLAFRKSMLLVSAALIGLMLGGILFGMIAHEESHAVACLIFGCKIASWSLDNVSYLPSTNETVNILVRLAGGLGQALFSFIFFFWLWSYFEKQVAPKSVCQVFEMKKLQILPSVVFGFELAFLAIAFHGIVSGLVEGFMFDFYAQNHANLSVWMTVIALCIVSAFGVLYARQNKYLKL